MLRQLDLLHSYFWVEDVLPGSDMQDILEKASSASRESKQIEFKCGFDPGSNGEWCELIKDIVAIANSGGGVIVFGVNDDGTLSGSPVEPIGKINNADLSSKLTKYTGCADPQVEIRELKRGGVRLPAFVISGAATPLVFGSPGTYDVGGGKQKTAFGRGTIYFRHGAKSDPGTTEDVRSTFERHLNQARSSWLKQVSKVVKAPAGSHFIVQSPTDIAGSIRSEGVRVVNDPGAIPVVLTRDRDKADGTFLHEEVSEAIFDEINNVVDANRVLTRGHSHFFFGREVYYRVYAERSGVRQDPSEFEMLFHAGAVELYAPGLFWAKAVDSTVIAKEIVCIYLAHKGLQIRWFMRMAVLLGPEFCNWVYQRWDKKWRDFSQPPSFYFSFGRMVGEMKGSDHRLVAARLSPSTRIFVPGQTEALCSELLRDRERANALLSAACMAVFEGDSQLRSTARDLDYLANGLEIVERGKQISEVVKELVGRQQPGDFKESSATE